MTLNICCAKQYVKTDCVLKTQLDLDKVAK